MALITITHDMEFVADGRNEEVFCYKDTMEAVARFIKENRRNAAPSAQN